MTFLCVVRDCGKLTQFAGQRCDFHLRPFFSRAFVNCPACDGSGAVMRYLGTRHYMDVCDRCGGSGRVAIETKNLSLFNGRFGD